MSVRTMSLVFEYNMPELKTDDGRIVPDSTAKFVLLALADHCNDEGEGAYIGVKRICKKTSLSSQTVCNALNALRHNGYTTLEGKSKVDTNNYTLNLDKLFQPLGFQPLESDDSSHKNPTILATRVKPSVKPSINRDAAPPAFDFSNMTVSQAYKVPTLKMFCKATGWLPADILWEQVHNFITDNSLTEEQIKAACIAWVGKGYNRRNVMGILEWAKNGTTGEYQPKQTEATPAVNEKAVQSTVEELAKKWNGNYVPRPSNIQKPQLGKQS